MAFDPAVTAFDFVLVNGRVSPGIAIVRKGKLPAKWDERMGPGWSGSFPVFMGLQLVPFEIVIRLVTPQDWEDWESWRTVVARPPAGKRPKALSIVHPWCNELDVSAFVVTDRTQPEPVDDGTVWEIVISCLSWRAPKRTLVKPEASGKPEVTDPYDKQIEALTGQLEALSGG